MQEVNTSLTAGKDAVIVAVCILSVAPMYCCYLAQVPIKNATDLLIVTV